MTFYPFLRNNLLKAELDLHCFSPTSSYPFKLPSLNLYLTWSDGFSWQIRFLYEITNSESIRVSNSLINAFSIPEDTLVLLFFSKLLLPNALQSLSFVAFKFKSFPVWRATISLEACTNVTSSYQGEINCFRANGSFLTFSSLYQQDLVNYLFFLNLQDSPAIAKHKLSFNNCSTPIDHLSCDVYTNSLNVINLDQYISGQSLYSISSQSLSGIPLFITTD